MGGKAILTAAQIPAGKQTRNQQKRQGFSSLFSCTSERGQELAEFALVLPLLFLLLFGAVDLGRVFHATITIANAAREGARYIALHNNKINSLSCIPGSEENWSGRCQAASEAQATGIYITKDNVSVSCLQTVSGTCDRMQPVQVTVTYNFQLILSPLIPGGVTMPGTDISIQRTAEMLVQ